MKSGLLFWLAMGAATAHSDDGGAADPDAPRVGASLDRTAAHVGDPLTLTVSAIAHRELAEKVELPKGASFGKFELLDSSTSDRDLGDGNRVRRFVLRIAAYETGELELPPIRLEYRTARGERRRIETTAIPVQITSLVGQQTHPEPQPPRPPRTMMIEDRRLVLGLQIAGAAIAGVLAIAWLIRRLLRQRRQTVAVVAPSRPLYEIALERLAELRRRGNFSEQEYQPFFFAVSEILRGYLAARFAFDALELTTSELVEALERIDDPALQPCRDQIQNFLQTSDLVKFAKVRSSDLEARAALDAAEGIVQATRTAPQPEVPHG